MLAALLGLVLANSSEAGFILSVTAPSSPIAIPTAGTTDFTVAVRLAADSGAQAVRGYTIPVDLRPPTGSGLPTGWTIVSVNQRFFGFTDAFPGFDKRGGVGDLPSQEGDASASNGNLISGPVNFTTTPVTLFDLTVRIDPTAAPGNYVAEVFSSGTLLEINDATGTPVPRANLQFQSASIELSAVPEPTGMLFCAGAGLALARLVRRPRRQTIQACRQK